MRKDEYTRLTDLLVRVGLIGLGIILAVLWL